MKRITLIFRMRLVLSFLFLFFTLPGAAQHLFNSTPHHQHDEKCAARFIEQKQEEMLGIYGSEAFFETWMEAKLRETTEDPSLRTSQTEVRRIPVVVHVIHNGTPVGEGANIPRAQIDAQIRTLNEDFRRLNPDAANTPELWREVAADARIEFVLAMEDPDGLPTSGINRVIGPQESYLPRDAGLISSVAFWPSEEYLNIWVVPLDAPNIGYASFPIADLPGLNFQPAPRETDGVTVDYRYFGEGGNAVSTARGRTLTHEIGHFFGLRHIWGDGDCSVDDFVEDTPNQARANNSCPTSPVSTCDSRDMIENYMDYTPDRCMNLFTLGQVARMDVVLANSPRRASLVNNRATTPPADLPPVSLAIRNLIQPGEFICETPLQPQIEVQNIGQTTLTSVRVSIRVNGSELYQQTLTTNLATAERATLTFNAINLSTTAANDFELEIVQINGSSAAVNASPNIIRSRPVFQASLDLPYQYTAEDFTSRWAVRNPDGRFTWQDTLLNIGGTPQPVVFIRSFEYEQIGELDYFISPPLDLTNLSNPQLSFDLAYAPFPQDGLEDRLWVAVSTDCGNTFSLVNAPYRKENIELQTLAPTRDEFFPQAENQFRKELVNLSNFTGLDNVRVAFISMNGFGNNIYLKNIRFTPSEELQYNFRLTRMISPGPVVDGNHENEVYEMENIGNLPISSFILSRQLNNAPLQTFIAQGNAIPPGERASLNLPASNLNAGTNRLNIEISRPNFDQNEGNTSRLARFIIQSPTDITAPWRQDFNEGSLAPWQIINPENNFSGWRFFNITTGDGPQRALELRNMAPGNSFWLVSPVFDLSTASRASVLFDRAYSHIGGSVRLRVLLSLNGGETYAHQLLSLEGERLASIDATGGVNPNNATDFERTFADLSQYAGGENDNARLAFVVDQGTETSNPVYLDNIELFFSDNPDPVIPGLGTTALFPNPATDVFNIAFNLETHEDVNIQFVDLAGRVIHDVDYPNTLNQTYTFSTQIFRKGVYVVRIRSTSLLDTRRVIIR